jgi:hypothetical protein
LRLRVVPLAKGVADIDSARVLDRIKELARAQCDADRIPAAIRDEFGLSAEDLRAIFAQPEVQDWIETCAVSGQLDLQARMWKVAKLYTGEPTGLRMSQWLARNFLGHSGSDVSAEVQALLAKAKADPDHSVALLDRALTLVQGGRP